MRSLMIFALTFLTIGAMAVELPQLPGDDTRLRTNGSLESIQNMINNHREAIAWLRENPAYPRQQEWINILMINEICYCHPSLVEAVEKRDAEMGTLIMNRFREYMDLRRVNLRNPAVLRNRDTFLMAAGGQALVRLDDETRSYDYQHAERILRVKNSGLRFRTPAEAEAGGVVPEENKPAGTEFLDNPPETDILGNPVPRESNRRSR